MDFPKAIIVCRHSLLVILCTCKCWRIQRRSRLRRRVVHTKSSSYRIAMGSNTGLKMLRGGAILAAASALLISTSFGQASGTPPLPQKPLRERLLDRAVKGDAEAQFDLAKGYEGGRFGLPQD